MEGFVNCFQGFFWAFAPNLLSSLSFRVFMGFASSHVSGKG